MYSQCLLVCRRPSVSSRCSCERATLGLSAARQHFGSCFWRHNAGAALEDPLLLLLCCCCLPLLAQPFASLLLPVFSCCLSHLLLQAVVLCCCCDPIRKSTPGVCALHGLSAFYFLLYLGVHSVGWVMIDGEPVMG